MRALTVAELNLNAESYVDYECLTLSAHLMGRSKEILFANMLSIENGQNEWYQTNDQMSAIKREAVNTVKQGAHVTLLASLGLPNVLQQPI